MPRLLPSPTQDARPAGAAVALLVLHYTGMQSAAAAIARLTDPAAKVSAHYVIDTDGAILALVPEACRAWHAGVAGWGAISDVNGQSIGIELVNPGHDWGYRPFPAAQIAALVELGLAIRARHGLPPGAVVGHSDVAPARKIDPGELFPWADLARHGLGVWPAAWACAAPDTGAALGHLRAIGYRPDLPDTTPAKVIAAFQRHWRPGRVDGRLDAATMGLILAVRRLSDPRPGAT
ncbi:MAG: N-acetylmuramoyl-L-alanine amidase [Geminicoccaceae bacterium]